ncbi:MAG: permease [Clostridiales bacterium]
MENIKYLILITFSLLILSFVMDRGKTIKALKIACKKFRNIFNTFISVIIIISIILVFIPETIISHYITGGNYYLNVFIALIIGSITMIPGFVAFPLSGILLKNGVSYMVISAFTTTLMMVGIITFPIEKKYFGFKVALLRNIVSLIIAILVSISTGILFGEVF